MNSIKLFNKLLNIWESEFSVTGNKYVPLVPIPPHPNCLLFVGLNPSFNVAAIKRLVNDTRFNPDKYYLWQNRDKFNPEKDISLHKKAKESYAYFSRFEKLAKSLMVEWDHTDLFFFRDTSQKNSRKLIFEGNKIDQLTAFARSQLEISSAIINASTPKCIVVSNALASDIYKEYNKLEFSTTRGCHIQVIGDKEIPVFLSSMLTGQRALDKYSFKRLAWHLGRELKVTIKLESAV